MAPWAFSAYFSVKEILTFCVVLELLSATKGLVEGMGSSR